MVWQLRLISRIQNQLDYPVGTRLKALPVGKYNVPQANTIEVTGYSLNYIEYNVYNGYFHPIVPTDFDSREEFQRRFQKMKTPN